VLPMRLFALVRQCRLRGHMCNSGFRGRLRCGRVPNLLKEEVEAVLPKRLASVILRAWYIEASIHCGILAAFMSHVDPDATALTSRIMAANRLPTKLESISLPSKRPRSSLSTGNDHTWLMRRLRAMGRKLEKRILLAWLGCELWG